MYNFFIKKKLKELDRALSTFIKYNSEHLDLIYKFIVINEYGKNTEILINILKKKYPLFIFLNKTKKQQGQAKSLHL